MENQKGLSKQGQKSGSQQLADPQTLSEGFGVSTAMQSAELAAVAVAASAKAEIESAYIIAMKRPRSEETARIKLMNVCRNLTFARKAKYSKPVGGGKIVGPSIRLAEEIMRNWGNVLVQQSSIYDDARKRVVKVVVKDLESNLSFSSEITIEKKVERRSARGREVLGERVNTNGDKVSIVVATEDELLVKEAALVSKTIRNNGLRLIPEHVIEEAMAVVDETLSRQAEDDPDKAIMQVANDFFSVGVPPEELERYIGHPIGQSNLQEIVELRAMFTSIKDGQARWIDFVGDKPHTKTAPSSGSMDGFGAGDPATHTRVQYPVGRPQDNKPQGDGVKKISAAQVRKLGYELNGAGISRGQLKENMGVASLSDLPASKMQLALDAIADSKSEREPGQEG